MSKHPKTKEFDIFHFSNKKIKSRCSHLPNQLLDRNKYPFSPKKLSLSSRKDKSLLSFKRCRLGQYFFNIIADRRLKTRPWLEAQNKDTKKKVNPRIFCRLSLTSSFFHWSPNFLQKLSFYRTNVDASSATDSTRHVSVLIDANVVKNVSFFTTSLPFVRFNLFEVSSTLTHSFFIRRSA